MEGTSYRCQGQCHKAVSLRLVYPHQVAALPPAQEKESGCETLAGPTQRLPAAALAIAHPKPARDSPCNPPWPPKGKTIARAPSYPAPPKVLIIR